MTACEREEMGARGGSKKRTVHDKEDGRCPELQEVCCFKGVDVVEHKPDELNVGWGDQIFIQQPLCMQRQEATP